MESGCLFGLIFVKLWFCGFDIGLVECELIVDFLFEIGLNYDWWLFFILCWCWEFGDLCLLVFDDDFLNFGCKFFVYCFKFVFKVIEVVNIFILYKVMLYCCLDFVFIDVLGFWMGLLFVVYLLWRFDGIDSNS